MHCRKSHHHHPFCLLLSEGRDFCPWQQGSANFYSFFSTHLCYCFIPDSFFSFLHYFHPPLHWSSSFPTLNMDSFGHVWSLVVAHSFRMSNVLTTSIVDFLCNLQCNGLESSLVWFRSWFYSFNSVHKSNEAFSFLLFFSLYVSSLLLKLILQVRSTWRFLHMSCMEYL